MSADRFMFTIFCDDVRQEAGGKFAYMGIYGANLLVPEYPAHLLKLCVVMTVRTLASRPPESLVFKLLRDEEVIYEHPVDEDALKQLIASTPASDIEGRSHTFGAVAQIVNLVFSEACMLKSRAIVDGKELKGGALELLAVDPKH
ncbi:MAG: hypothetical protein RL033_977 [Pseudomonadota bacterium]